jgi:hypothetical protein
MEQGKGETRERFRGERRACCRMHDDLRIQGSGRDVVVLSTAVLLRLPVSAAILWRWFAQCCGLAVVFSTLLLFLDWIMLRIILDVKKGVGDAHNFFLPSRVPRVSSLSAIVPELLLCFSLHRPSSNLAFVQQNRPLSARRSPIWGRILAR